MAFKLNVGRLAASAIERHNTTSLFSSCFIMLVFQRPLRQVTSRNQFFRQLVFTLWCGLQSMACPQGPHSFQGIFSALNDHLKNAMRCRLPGVAFQECGMLLMNVWKINTCVRCDPGMATTRNIATAKKSFHPGIGPI